MFKLPPNMAPISALLLLLLPHLVLSSTQKLENPPHSLATDRDALLAIKKKIIMDPLSSLWNWNESVHVCNFSGIQCDTELHRVVKLDLQGAELLGPLSPIISNLTGLKMLLLVNNHLFGSIPSEFSSLRHLRHIRLDGNDLHGTIPNSFALLSNLTMITLIDNNLSGAIPPSLFKNCTLLDNVDLSSNILDGEIPEEVGNCPNLWNLNLYDNRLTGQLPTSLINVTRMYNLDLEYNHLSDKDTGLDLFFTALANCTSLEELELAGLGLGGKLPDSIGVLGGNLKNLLLQENQIFGSIPSSLANLPNLTLLNLTSNFLNGSIPAEISQMPNLEQLFLSYNLFEGAIPASLGQFRRLGLLDLSNNRFYGEIPAGLGDLVQANSLLLNNNLLSGKIPPSLGQCTALYKLDLSYNRLTGTIPPEILGINEIRIFLNLSHNNLEGPLPMELSKLEKVQEMDLSSNNFNGTIFFQISNCIELTRLNLSNNSLEGSLPDSLGDLKNLASLDVSGNKLSGLIPMSLAKIQSLIFLNLSSNNFKGEVPTGGIFSSNITYMSFLHNRHLCGAISGMRVCSKKKNWLQSRRLLVIFALGIFVSAFLTIICCAIGFQRIKLIISSRRIERTRKQKTVELLHNFPRITYRELEDATEGFNERSLIGSGSYGRVYRGALPDGTAIAVKVLQLQSGNSTKSFNRECQVLKRIRHRNLMRIITACSLPDFKALVLPFMANGSLDSHLYPPAEAGQRPSSADLSLIQRVSICSDIAEGMAYLHHHSPVRVIHCDLKPSNVLLNDEMTALVSDFGIARLVMTVGAGNAAAIENMGNSTGNLLCGSIGYIAPEYAFGSNTSTKGDVYSFGVLVLEMVTRKRSTDEMFVGGMSLHRWVKSHYQGRMERVIDSSLLRATSDLNPEVRKMWEVGLLELIELGTLCTQESPSTRPTMLDAADDLDRLKRYLTGDTTATFTSSLGISSSTIADD